MEQSSRSMFRPALLALAVVLVLVGASRAFAQIPISQAGWTVEFVDSQAAAQGYPAANSFDGNPNTFWHTQYVGGNPPPPHEIRINLQATYNITGLRYLPRQDGPNGRIAQYEFYVSADGINWGTAVATSTFPNSAALQEVLFTPKSGKFIKLRALSEVNGQLWTSVAELNVLIPSTTTGPPGPPGPPGPAGPAGPAGATGAPGADAPVEFGGAQVLIKRNNVLETWAQYSTRVGSPLGDSTGGTFRASCTPANNLPCELSLRGALLSNASTGPWKVYPRVLIQWEEAFGDGTTHYCEYGDGAFGSPSSPNPSGYQTVPVSPLAGAYTFGSVPINIGGTADCGAGQVVTASEDVATILLPIGRRYGVFTSFIFAKVP